MATVVADSVKESLLGSTTPDILSASSRTAFLKFARRDEDGQPHMTEEDFVDAIAPPDQDYVRLCPLWLQLICGLSPPLGNA